MLKDWHCQDLYQLVFAFFNLHFSIFNSLLRRGLFGVLTSLVLAAGTATGTPVRADEEKSPWDPAGIEDALKQAREKGVKVLAWDDNLQNADMAWLIDNHKLGYLIGEQAAKWINEKLGGKAEVAILNYPQLPILLERGNGIKEAITKLAPNAKIVAETSAINPAEGISKMETIFQSNPNVKVVGCIGAGGSVGANESAKAANKITDNFGIFAADATQPELLAIKNNEGIRMSVTITGTNKVIAEKVWDMVDQLASGKPIEKKEIYREMIPVTKENVDQYLNK